jgi:hypothetical protein
VFNEIVVVPGFEKNTAKYREEHGLDNLKASVRSSMRGGDQKDIDYVGTSPHAGYDHNRMKRNQ